MTHPQTQDDEALVEMMARAMADADAGGLRAHGIHAEIKHWRAFEKEARAALNALRNHEGRK